MIMNPKTGGHEDDGGVHPHMQPHAKTATLMLEGLEWLLAVSALRRMSQEGTQPFWYNKLRPVNVASYKRGTYFNILRTDVKRDQKAWDEQHKKGGAIDRWRQLERDACTSAITSGTIPTAVSPQGAACLLWSQRWHGIITTVISRACIAQSASTTSVLQCITHAVRILFTYYTFPSLLLSRRARNGAKGPARAEGPDA